MNNIQSFLFPTTPPTPKETYIKVGAGAVLATLAIWLTNRPFFVPALIALSGAINIPNPDQKNPSENVTENSPNNSRNEAKLAAARARKQLLQQRTLRPLHVGAHIACVLYGAIYAYKAARLTPTMLSLLTPAYYALPIVANSWMLIAYSRQIVDEKLKTQE